MAEREPLTDDEKQAIAEACVCDPHGWVPHPENLPLAEGLVERGTLTRTAECGKAVYRPSEQFKHAAALHAAMFRECRPIDVGEGRTRPAQRGGPPP